MSWLKKESCGDWNVFPAEDGRLKPVPVSRGRWPAALPADDGLVFGVCRLCGWTARCCSSCSA